MPLAIKAAHLSVNLSIQLLIRPNAKTLLTRGDIDNRTKTLIDGLRKPSQATEVHGIIRNHDLNDPLFVLMEDDDMVNELSVSYSTLLDYDAEHPWSDHVVARISVSVSPSLVTMDNTMFL